MTTPTLENIPTPRFSSWLGKIGLPVVRSHGTLRNLLVELLKGYTTYRHFIPFQHVTPVPVYFRRSIDLSVNHYLRLQRIELRCPQAFNRSRSILSLFNDCENYASRSF